MHMAHTPHAFAVAKIDPPRPFAHGGSSIRSAHEAVHEALRADGLNAIERSEREAALDENRAEEAEIFERAAARLKPSWSTADAMLDLGLANALPQAAEPAQVAVPAPPVASLPSVPAFQSAPVVSAAFAPAFPLPARASVELTDRFIAQPGATSFAGRASSLLRQRRVALIALALGCVGVGGAWAALSGGAEPAAKPAPKAAIVAPPPPAPAPAVPPPAPPVASQEPAAPARKLPPKAAKLAKRPLAAQGRPATKPLAARSGAGKPMLARPVAKPLAKKPLGPKTR